MSPFSIWFGGATGSHLGYGTHLHVLTSAILQSEKGPLLEMGVGFYSTPLLHLLGLELDRKVLSLESDGPWLENFESFRSENHEMRAVPNWQASEEFVDAVSWWAVAFVDHGDEPRRETDAIRLKRRAEYVVVHDWSPGRDQENRILEHFQHRWVSKVGPQTAVLSNVRPFALTGLR